MKMNTGKINEHGMKGDEKSEQLTNFRVITQIQLQTQDREFIELLGKCKQFMK